MSIIAFNGYDFNPKNVTGVVESPANIRSKMLEAVLSYVPQDVEVKEFTNTTSISRDNKKINLTVCKFSLNDWPNGKPFSSFYKDGSEYVVVWGLQFYEDNKFRSDICENANLKCAMGYPLAEERKAMFMLGTKASMYVRSMGEQIHDFFANEDVTGLINLMVDSLPMESKIVKQTPTVMVADIPVNDYIATVTYREDGRFTARIPHKYTDTDRAYGAQYIDYVVKMRLVNKDEIKNLDWDRLLDNLYRNRNGKCTYMGSLGT